MPYDRLGVAAGEFIRYAVVGALSNAVLFLLYLLMTQQGFGHKLAATIAYFLGVLQTFVLNRKWSFKHDGQPVPALGRYVLAYLIGYLTNIVGLVVFVDAAGLAHQWVQGAMVVLVALMVFGLQKFWVFRKTAPAQ